MIEPAQQQKEILRQAATNAGITGKLYIDVNPKECFLRLKVINLTNFDASDLINMLCSALVMVGQSINLEVKTHIRQGGEND